MLYTIYDTETSGLEEDADILSFSYMLCDENLRVGRAETLYFWKEGETKWTEEAYKIHGLSKEFLRQHADKFEDNLKKMYIVLSYAYTVGYNSGYLKTRYQHFHPETRTFTIDDNPDGGTAVQVVMGFDFPRCKRFLLNHDIEAPNPSAMIDVMRELQRYNRGIKRKLQKAYDQYGLSRELADMMNQAYFTEKSEAHNSAYDVVCTAILFSYMKREGMISDKVGMVDLFEDVEQNTDSEYVLYFDDNCSLRVKVEGEDVDMPMDEFVKEYPVIGAKIAANPHAYLQAEV